MITIILTTVTIVRECATSDFSNPAIHRFFGICTAVIFMVLAISLLTALYLVIKEMRLQSLENAGPQINKFKCVFISFTIAYGLRALWQIGLGHY